MQLLLRNDASAPNIVDSCVAGLRSLWQEVSVRRCLGSVVAAWVGVRLWQQYGILLTHRRLPQRDMGLPLIGHTLSILKYTLEGLGLRLVDGREVVLTNYMFDNAVLVSYPVYLKHMQRAELDGEFEPKFPPTLETFLGPNSILSLPGGKGHAHHKRLRNKILATLGPKHALSLTQDILQLIRVTLDEMAAKTARAGHCTFNDVAIQMASRASALPITAGLNRDVQERLELLLQEVLAGVMAVPLDLGRLSQFGRSKLARREVVRIIKGIMESPPTSRQSTVANLMRASEEGEAFSTEEIVDTCFTLLVGGQLTTSDALPELLVQLSLRRDWVKKIAEEEPLEPSSIEHNSATLRFIREVMRMRPPLGGYRRWCPGAPVDLGEHGVIPAGVPFAICFSRSMRELGADFDPDRWTPDLVRESFLIFGGNQPHNCVGKNFALLELQLFVRVLCREYDFETLDTVPRALMSHPLSLSYPNMLRVKVSHKPKTQ